MEESSSYGGYMNLLVIRPVLAISFVFSFILFGWFLAWKLVLVHVPLVQEIFGLRKKTVKPKPPGRRRLSKFYNDMSATNSSPEWVQTWSPPKKVPRPKTITPNDWRHVRLLMSNS